jgi:hypothetical protein
VTFAAINFCVASQRMFVVVVVVVVVNFVMTQSGNFWIHPRISLFGIILLFQCDIIIDPIRWM